jgi:sodium/bile acid cotransporter 7
MGVPLINVLYSSGDPGTVGVLSTPLLLYHVEQLILGNIEVEILKKWVNNGEKKRKALEAQQDAPYPRDEEESAYHNNTVDSEVTQVPSHINPSSHTHLPSPLSQLHYYDEK